MDEWMTSTEKCVCVGESMTQGGWTDGRGGVAVRMAAECVVISALKKHEKHRRTQFHETSPQRVYFNDAVYFIGVQ